MGVKMSRPLCSVVLATYERDHLLQRSLEAYVMQDFDNDRFELVVVDDHSTDDTRETVLDWSLATQIAATVVTPGPKNGYWRDCAAVLNAGIRASRGEHIILTHPEVIPGRKSVAACVEKIRTEEAIDWKRRVYAACKVYYLSPRDQVRIDSVPWQTDGNLAMREIEGFYDESDGGNPDYEHKVTDQVATPGFRLKTWDSFVFGGCSRETWKHLGGMLETQKWGSVDVMFNKRRKILGMVEWTCPDDDTIVVHQNHDLPGDVATSRDREAWKEECSQFDTRPEALYYPAVDHLWGE
jgi:glycosyltransferase involved in cell wall biosynthesis